MEQVTQADRDAAANGYFAWVGSNHVMPDKMRAGSVDDHSIVQAFARHRIAHSPSADPALRESGVEHLSADIAADPDVAWGWHCNVAVPIMDVAGVSHKVANETAAHLMQHLFGYDVTTDERYVHVKSGAPQPLVQQG